jgi:CheY-like chemotaxis protein
MTPLPPRPAPAEDSATDMRSRTLSTTASTATPMIALSSHAEDEDVRAGREAGFDDYLAKSDQNSLSDNLARAIRLAVSARDTEQRRRAS